MEREKIALMIASALGTGIIIGSTVNELGMPHFVNFGWGVVMSILGIGFAYKMK